MAGPFAGSLNVHSLGFSVERDSYESPVRRLYTSRQLVTTGPASVGRAEGGRQALAQADTVLSAIPAIVPLDIRRVGRESSIRQEWRDVDVRTVIVRQKSVLFVLLACEHTPHVLAGMNLLEKVISPDGVTL